VIGLDRLSLNQMTVHRLGVDETARLCARHGIPAVGLWREPVAELGVRESAVAVRRAGLHVSSLCRGGFFTRAGADAGARRAAHRDNLAALEEAAVLEADTLVLVCGGLVPGSRDLGLAHALISDGIAALVPRAAELGVRLGIEPLHPMFCADRCAVNRLADALDLAEQFPAGQVGVVIDSYHVWWDPRVGADIARAAGRIAGYQVCDWVVPLPADALLGRGHLGDGSIDFRALTGPVLSAGYTGFTEVEIMNEKVWDAPADETAATVKTRFSAVLGR
jgi:sugar phosphate isomerase/epimerase